MPDPFAVSKAYRLITDTGGTRHLVDGGGVRYFTEAAPGAWEIAVEAGNWAAWQAIAESLRATPQPEPASPLAAGLDGPEMPGQLPFDSISDEKGTDHG
jgi:hypothetical protein